MASPRAEQSSSKRSIQIKCDICEKTFNHKGTFDRHLKTVHLEEKNYKCEECQKHFSSNWHLKRHKNDVHTQRMKYSCPECPEYFSQLENLKRHQKRGKHTFEYTCDHCDETFRFTSKEALQSFFWNRHLIDQYKSYETCTGALNLPEDKKIELLKRRKEDQREENARSRATMTWRGFPMEGDFETYEKKIIEEYKITDEDMDGYIKDHKQYWWWHKEDGIRIPDEILHSKRKNFITAEKRRIHEEKAKMRASEGK